MSNRYVVEAIEKILDFVLPCEVDLEEEVLCDECPFNIIPEKSCGIVEIHTRALTLKKEMEKNEQ